MACNSCHNHGGGVFDEFLLKHNSLLIYPNGTTSMRAGVSDIPEKSPMKKYLIMGAIVLGAIIVAKKLK